MIRLIALLILMTLASERAHADAFGDCNQNKDLERRINGCTTVLGQKKLTKKNRAIAHYFRGLAYHMSRKEDLAYKDYSAAIKHGTKNYSVYFNRALIFTRHAKSDLAIKDFTKAIELNPKYENAYHERGSLYFDTLKYKLAIADFTKYIELKPKDDKGYFERARSYRNNKQFDLARADFKKAIKLNPGNKAAVDQLAYMESKLHQVGHEQSQGPGAKDCSQSKDLDHKISGCSSLIRTGKLDKRELSAAYGARGHAYRNKGRHELAIIDFNKAIRHDPTNGFAFLNRAISYAKTGRRDEAIADFKMTTELLAGKPQDALARKALEQLEAKSPAETPRAGAKERFRARLENSKADFKRGLEYRKKREFKKAIAAHTAALTVLPGREEFVSMRAEAHLDRGRAHFALGQYDLAISDYTETLKLNPREYKALNNRGISYRQKKQPDKAIADLTAAIKLKPKFDVFYYNRGLAYEDLGQYDQAIVDLNIAIQLNSKEADSFYYRGRSYYKKGAYDRAIADYDKAIQLNPKLANAHRDRGYSYSRLGKSEKANADYTQAKILDPKIIIDIPKKATTGPAPPKAGGGGSSEVELAFWNDVKNSDDPQMLQAYLDQFPNGTFARLAQIKLQKLNKAR